jgi:hypothetical protein
MYRPALQLAIGLSLATVAAWAPAEVTFIAGTTPYERPANAPRQIYFAKGAEWYCRAVTGIERPFPPSLRFLDDQEGWYSPFVVAGMTGPYDIRHWHASGSCWRR